MIYFDYAATTPVDPLVVGEMQPYYFQQFGNPASPHSMGRHSQKALEDARSTIADFIGARPKEIIFTSGATEANNQALYSVARQRQNQGKHIICSQIEHHSVLGPIHQLENDGWSVSWLKPDPSGIISPDAVQQAIKPETVLIAVMHANNEIGTIQPVSAIGEISRKAGILFLVDAVQTVGHVPVNVDELQADYLTMSAHKCYGPKGVGALYIREGSPCASLISGGDQENGLRASTVNVPGIVGFAKALSICENVMLDEAQQQSAQRDRLLAEIPQLIPDTRINGHQTQRLPNNAHFIFPGLQAEALLMALDMKGFATSMGSACTSGALEPSHVLRAIGLSDDLTMGALRLTLGRWTTTEQIDQLLSVLPESIMQVRV